MDSTQYYTDNFDYFDQFSLMEVDLTEYLTNFSTDTYQLKFSSIQPVKTQLKNLFDHYNLIIDYAKADFAFEIYNINEGEKPEFISFKKYGTTDYWWLIYTVNDIKNPFLDWPLSHSQLNNLVDKLYKEEGKYSREFYQMYLQQENEKKSVIRIPKKDQLMKIIWQYRKAILDKGI